MGSRWGSCEWVFRLRPSSTYLAGGVVSLATLTAGYYLYKKYQRPNEIPSHHGPGHGVTQESVDLELGQVALLGVAHASIKTDLERLAEQALDAPAFAAISGPLLPWKFSPLYCGAVIIWTGRSLCSDLVSSIRNHMFSFSWNQARGSKRTEVKMRSVCIVRGTEARLWWAVCHERSRLTPNGSTYVVTTVMAVTGVQLAAGRVRQYQSHIRTETEVNVPFLDKKNKQTELSAMEASMVVGPDGIPRSTVRTSCVSKDNPNRWGKQDSSSGKQDSSSEDDDSTQDEYSDEDSDDTEDRGYHGNHGTGAQATDDDVSDVCDVSDVSDVSDDHHVGNDEDDETDNTPCLSLHFTDRGYFRMPYRVATLRQAFTTLCGNPESWESLLNAARWLLGGLAAAAQKDKEVLCQRFDQLVDYVLDASHRDSIMEELAQEGLSHLNTLDVVFELVLLGMLDQNHRRPAVIVPGGFMSQLYKVLEAFLPDDTEDAPGQTYLEELKELLLDFLEDIFSSPTSLYSIQSDLAFELMDQVQRHLKTMFNNLLRD